MRVSSQAGRLCAIGFLLVDHDPSRTSGPSGEGLMATRELQRPGEDLIYLLYHLVIGRDWLRQVAT